MRAEALGASRRVVRWRRRRLRGRWAAAAIVAMAVAYLAGFARFVVEIDRLTPPVAGDADAIVVPTGGGQRVAVGFELLSRRRAPRLFITGVDRSVDLPELERRVGVAGAAPDCCVELGYTASDTAGNAEETAEWSRRNHIRSILLVTADYHMPRGVFEFRRAMPDVALSAYPVASSLLATGGWRNRRARAILMAEYGKYLLARLRAGVSEFLTLEDPGGPGAR